MGKINQGILDGFSGKVGTVVGMFWKGKPVMRGYKRFIKDRHSEAQLIVRLRFAELSRLSSVFREASLLGFANRSKAHGNTEMNNFVQLNWEAVSANTRAEVNVEYSALQLSAGSLVPVLYGAVSYATPQTVEVGFEGCLDYPGTSERDKVYLFAYNPTSGRGMLGTGADRRSGKATLTVPASWAGEQVHLWAFVVGGGNENKGMASVSTYLGEGTIG